MPVVPSNGDIPIFFVLGIAKVVTHLTKRMLYMAQFYVAEGKFDRLKKRAMGLLAKAGGTIDHTTLLRKLSIDAVTFKKLIVTLEMSSLIEREIAEYGKQIIHLCAA